MVNSIKFVGVGGQGTILAAKIMCTVLINAGYDVKMSEIHGMSQRNGSVSSEVRYGDKVFSPVIEKGSADFLISFEQMEAARHINYLKKDGILIVNNHKINSMITLNGKIPYPDRIIEKMEDKVKEQIAMAKLNLFHAIDVIETAGKHSIISFTEGDEQRMMLMGLKRFTKYTNQPNPLALRKQIAKELTEANEYCF
jgi:indolepyruvate ferredoxin oxidoreductase beta subunit